MAVKRLNITERDRRIFEAIHYTYDGMMGAKQIERLFFNSWRMARGRLGQLYKTGYLMRPTRKQRWALTDMPYWLTDKSAEILSRQEGMILREFSYRKNPRWGQINHDLAVNDFQIDVQEACTKSQKLEFIEWIPQGEFWRDPDFIKYTNENGVRRKRGIRPDGYFVIKEKQISRFLVEIDMSTEDNPRFGREKTLPLVAYLRSKAYKTRFGKSGRILVVTTSSRRLQNMKRQTEKMLPQKDAKWFCFTTFEMVTTDSIFTEPIWYVGGVGQPVSLLDKKVWTSRS